MNLKIIYRYPREIYNFLERLIFSSKILDVFWSKVEKIFEKKMIFFP